MKKMRRVLAILLVLAMAMSTLAACGTKTEDKGQSTTTTNKTETGKTESGDTGATEVADEWTWPLAETKEVSIWTWWANDYFTDPNELKGIQAIEAATNVHVNWVWVSQAEAVEKFGLMMASGDYPDILRSAESYYTGGLVQACTDGVIIDMTEYVEKYMPTYMALRTSSEKLAKDTVTDDGRMVGVYTIASKNGEVMGILYNKKTIKKLDGGTFWLSGTPDKVSKGWDGACNRTATWGIFEHIATGKKFCYINTHLDHKGTEAQKEGMKLIVKKFKEYNPDGYPQFLTGDLNVKSDNVALDVLKDYMVNTRSAAPKDRTDNNRTHNGFSTSGGSIIDHIYCTKDMQVVEYHTITENYGTAEYVSDHYPVYAIIKM